MFTNRTLDRLNKMLDAAIAGDLRESDYDESKLSQVESKWKHFLGASALSKENLEKEKRIELLVECEEDLEACYDMKWTKEALANVLDNAVKYSHEGGTVKVSVIKYELYTAVAVKDGGIGISEEETPKIFGRFYRASDVQQEDGVGIGLYLSREILRKENGYIMVKSKKGEGSEFILHLLSNEI